VSKAKRKHTPKTLQRQEAAPSPPPGTSPELQSLIETHGALSRGDWNVGLAVKNRHGHESDIAKHVEKVFMEQNRGRELAFTAVMSFPARGYADIAVKLAFASQQWPVSAVPEVSLAFSAALTDAKRLAQATPPEAADKALLDAVSAAEAAMVVHQALSRQLDAEREQAEHMADAAGYHEMKGYAPGEAWRARNNFIDQVRPARSYDRWNAAHKEIGRTAKAVFAVKAKTLRGAAAKLRLVIALIKADDLDTWEGNRDWLAETLADFERIAAAK
jgi:hypothetical protein